MKIIIINGPNLNLLGARECGLYGNETLKDIEEYIIKKSSTFNVACEFFQSNNEGLIIDKLQSCLDFDGIIINAGAYSHYSYAIFDCIKSLKTPVIEVHMTNIYAREEWRKSVISPACIGVVSGFGKHSYLMAIYFLNEYLKK